MYVKEKILRKRKEREGRKIGGTIVTELMMMLKRGGRKLNAFFFLLILCFIMGFEDKS